MKRSISYTKFFSLVFATILCCGKAPSNFEVLPGEKPRMLSYILWNVVLPAKSVFYEQSECSWILEADADEEYREELTIEEPKITRIHFPNFEILFHDFMGYGSDRGDGTVSFYLPYANEPIDTGRVKWIQSTVYDESSEEESYVQYVQTNLDTLFLSEDLDERINNTLIEIVPHAKEDRFRISMCYLSDLYEVIDDRGLTWEQTEKLYAKQERYYEKTKTIGLNDSAQYFFRALPHTPDMVPVDVVDGKVVQLKYNNTAEQIQHEQILYDDEFSRIRAKYSLRDTLVIIPGEYNTVATLTRDRKLYNYTYRSYVFKIDRLIGKKVVETRHIVISIAYGC
jgi:hypothetical protein